MWCCNRGKSGPNYAKRIFFTFAATTVHFLGNIKTISKIKAQKHVYPYKYVLTYPGKGLISVNCPNNSKCNAQWRNSQCKIGYSSQERYFNEWLRSIFEPPGHKYGHLVPNSKKKSKKSELQRRPQSIHYNIHQIRNFQEFIDPTFR